MHLVQLRNPHCRDCTLHATSKNVCIFGRGNPAASVMILGEAPGEAEALHGEPFCGVSGQFMQERLDALGMAEDVYITNAVKCHPPYNRKPLTLERLACKRYLDRELAFVGPRVIIAVGKTACESLRQPHEPRHILRHVIGKPWMFVSTWHPAYCLRMGKPDRLVGEFVAALIAARDHARRPR